MKRTFAGLSVRVALPSGTRRPALQNNHGTATVTDSAEALPCGRTRHHEPVPSLRIMVWRVECAIYPRAQLGRACVYGQLTLQLAL